MVVVVDLALNFGEKKKLRSNICGVYVCPCARYSSWAIFMSVNCTGSPQDRGRERDGGGGGGGGDRGGGWKVVQDATNLKNQPTSTSHSLVEAGCTLAAENDCHNRIGIYTAYIYISLPFQYGWRSDVFLRDVSFQVKSTCRR